jgi:excisionase family DNA binding protein
VPFLLTQAEVAEVLRSSTRTVRRLTAAGKLTAVNVEGSVRYRTSDVEEYVAGLGPQPMRERITLKSSAGSAGAAGSVGASGTTTPGPGAEHQGAA